jgi:hypothetical protein
VRDHIERITLDLERHKTRLLTDVTALDRLYDANLAYFRELEHYIAAGDAKLAELDSETIPAGREGGAASDMVQAQNLRDLRGARDDLERRVHDLRLTRQVAMQALPSIRLVQENDKGLINKINSTLVNTVPLWRQQLAQAITIYRSGRAAETVKAATDLTNELLRANAENLKTANAEARKQIERGVFDIETVKQANQALIETIEESLAIADEGKRARAAPPPRADADGDRPAQDPGGGIEVVAGPQQRDVGLRQGEIADADGVLHRQNRGSPELFFELVTDAVDRTGMRYPNRRHVDDLPVDQLYPVVLGEDAGLTHA